MPPILYVKLDANYGYDAKIIAVGLEGAGLYAIALGIAKRILSDGVLQRAQLQMHGASDELIDRMVEVGLFASDAPDAVRITAWESHHAPASEVIKGSGGEGAHKRWHVKRGITKPGCPWCEDAKPQVNADADAPHMGGNANRMDIAMPVTEAGTRTDTASSSIGSQLPVVEPGEAAAEGRARQAVDVLARREVAARTAAGRPVKSPGGLARTIADRDLWPLLGAQLTTMAEMFPDADSEALADMPNPIESPPDDRWCPSCGGDLANHDDIYCRRTANEGEAS